MSEDTPKEWKSDKWLGEPRLNAPRILAPEERSGLYFRGVWYTYAEAETMHKELAQLLAKGMRKRGP